MRVLIATMFPYPHVGGVSTHLAALIEQLSARKFLQGVIHGGHLGSSPYSRLTYAVSWLINRDAARYQVYQSRAIRLQKRIACSAFDGRPLLIHCHDPLASCAALRAGVPSATIVQTVHGPWSRESRMSGVHLADKTYRLIRRFEQEAFSGIDMALPVDRGQASILIDEFGMPAERTRTIENAVDVEILAAIPPPSDVRNATTPYFIVPRRLVSKNGVEFAIRALAELDGFDVRLMIAGDGPLRNSLIRMSEELEIRSRVEFLGNVAQEQLLPLMKGSQAVLVPSVPANGVIEATSLAVLEAMALGVPVIGSAIGGIADILMADDKSEKLPYGFLTPPGDAAGLASAMRTVLRLEPAARKLLAERALFRVQERYSVKRWIEDILTAYQLAIENRSKNDQLWRACG